MQMAWSHRSSSYFEAYKRIKIQQLEPFGNRIQGDKGPFSLDNLESTSNIFTT